MGEIELLQV